MFRPVWLPASGEQRSRGGEDQIRAHAHHALDPHWTATTSGPEENPVSVHQPMMCQHCQNAPCETVCPVLATTTSSEGLNQQVYNRCIGTRYCANNCPYKVRRFNGTNYTENRSLISTWTITRPHGVESRRGRTFTWVMEKCSLCVQRIQLARTTRCRKRSWPTAISKRAVSARPAPRKPSFFGDLKDPTAAFPRCIATSGTTRCWKTWARVPNIGYLKKVRTTGGLRKEPE